MLALSDGAGECGITRGFLQDWVTAAPADLQRRPPAGVADGAAPRPVEQLVMAGGETCRWPAR